MRGAVVVVITLAGCINISVPPGALADLGADGAPYRLPEPDAATTDSGTDGAMTDAEGDALGATAAELCDRIVTAYCARYVACQGAMEAECQQKAAGACLPRDPSQISTTDPRVVDGCIQAIGEATCAQFVNWWEPSACVGIIHD